MTAGVAPGAVAGRDVEEATAALAAEEGRDRESVRATLSQVSADGVVSVTAAEDTLAEVAKHVATVETRVELAESAVESARESAAPVSHLDAVDARLDRYESRLDDVERSADGVRTDLGDLSDRLEPGSLYEVGTGFRRLRDRSRRVQAAADELQQDLDDFGDWLADPEERRGELAGDVDAVTAFVDEVAGDVDALPETAADPAHRWFDADLRRRVADLLLADLRAELADLRAWPDADVPDRVDPVAGRLDELAERTDALGTRLDALARPAWQDRVADRRTAAVAALEGHEPPVDWAAVQRTLAAHRPDA